MTFPSQRFRRRDPDPVVKESTKQRIIEEGAHIILRKGFNNTGIQEVLEAAGVPKGSFYFHFRNKEDFGLKVVDYFARSVFSTAEGFFGDDTLPYLERLRGFFRSFIELFSARGFSGG